MFRFILLKFSFVTVLVSLCIASSYEERTVYTQALLTVKYDYNAKFNANGKFAKESPKSGAQGPIYYAGEKETWCRSFGKIVAIDTKSPWIALIPKENSSCSDSKKISIAKKYNASAVIIYYNKEDEVPVMSGTVYSMKTIMIDLTAGKRIIEILKSNSDPDTVKCEIIVGTHYVDRRWKVSRTSVLFVLVSFILLMCISLAWLVFYYVQRFRHIYRNDRKEKQLLTAAKKAISKLKTRGFQDSNKDETDDSCAVCLENYKDNETLRILPCRHEFHKCCIDPWLLNHRTCPMCKSNILKSLGVDIPEPRENNINYDSEYTEAQRADLRLAGLINDSDEPVIDVIMTQTVPPTQAWASSTQNGENRYSNGSNLSDADSDRSTTALVSNA